MENHQLSYNEQVSDCHLELISRAHCTKWRRLPPYLGLANSVKDDIDRKSEDESDKRYDFLIKWKEIKGSEATYKALIDGLRKLDCMNDVEFIHQLMQPPPPCSRATEVNSTTTSPATQLSSATTTTKELISTAPSQESTDAHLKVTSESSSVTPKQQSMHNGEDPTTTTATQTSSDTKGLSCIAIT